MSDVVIAALIGAAASIIVNLIAASNQRKKRALFLLGPTTPAGLRKTMTGITSLSQSGMS